VFPGAARVEGRAVRFDLTSLGELVIDLVPVMTPAGVAYLPMPGGAPGNVAAGLARLGHPSAMITKVGQEVFGETAVSALGAMGVSLDAVIRTGAHNTALAVVSLTKSGESDFFFYRENCADSNLSMEEVPEAVIAASRVLHVGTLPLATPVSAAAQRHAIDLAKARGVRVSADVNFRAAFWRDPNLMRAAGREVAAAANILKVSAAELMLLTGIADPAEAVRSLLHPGLIAVAVTKGAGGAELFSAGRVASVPIFPVEVVDTVGCGDAFMATLIASLIERDFEVRDAEDLRAITLRCAAAGAIVATRAGGLCSMPTRHAIEDFLAARPVDVGE
jgi:fructokinase